MKKILVVALSLMIISCKENAQKPLPEPDKEINQLSKGSMKIVGGITVGQKGYPNTYTLVTKIVDGVDTFYVATNITGGIYLMKK